MVFTTTIAGSVAEFDADAYARNLAALVSRPLTDIQLNVSAASVRVEATITAADEANAADIVQVLASKKQEGDSSLSSSLGVQVEDSAEPYTFMPAQPGESPLQRESQSPAQPDDADDDGISGGIITLIVVLLIVCIAFFALLLYWHRQRQGKEQKPSSYVSAVTIHDASAASTENAKTPNEEATAAPTELESVVIRPIAAANVAETGANVVGCTSGLDSPKAKEVQREWLDHNEGRPSPVPS